MSRQSFLKNQIVTQLIVVAISLFAADRAYSGLPATGNSEMPNLRAKEYAALKENVSAFHTYSFFGPDKPWLFDAQTAETYPQEFARANCTDGFARRGSTKITCARLFDNAVLSKLAETYFAADTSAVGKTCANEPLICEDLRSLEVLFRNLHNASIEDSKQEKLGRLEDWRRGQLTDEQLKAILHLDFKYENGELRVGLR